MSARLLDERLAKWIERDTAADTRVAKLENELRLLREALASRDNENHSLQLTLDLIVSEKSLLLARLAETDRAIGDVSSLIELLTAALAATHVERKRLVAEIAESHDKLELLRGTLMATEHELLQLEQMRSMAFKTHSETLLADTVTF